MAGGIARISRSISGTLLLSCCNEASHWRREVRDVVVVVVVVVVMVLRCRCGYCCC